MRTNSEDYISDLAMEVSIEKHYCKLYGIQDPLPASMLLAYLFVAEALIRKAIKYKDE